MDLGHGRRCRPGTCLPGTPPPTSQRRSRVLVPLRLAPTAGSPEAAARDLDLRKWWSFPFKGPSIAHEYARIEHLPETIPLADFSFEGPLFRRSIFKQIGYPRPDFFFQGDDTEYACRIRFRAKAEMVCVTDARIVRLRGMVPDPPVNDWRHFYGLRNTLCIQKDSAKIR